LYDLIVKNGLLIDPSQGIHAQKDIAFSQGKVAAVDDELSAEPRKDALQVIDASERIVTPGIIDLHVHVRRGIVDALLSSGATTNFDAGTYGATNLDNLRYLRQQTASRIYGYLNISSLGLPGRPR
jgi:dihydroorotase